MKGGTAEIERSLDHGTGNIIFYANSEQLTFINRGNGYIVDFSDEANKSFLNNIFIDTNYALWKVRQLTNDIKLKGTSVDKSIMRESTKKLYTHAEVAEIQELLNTVYNETNIPDDDDE